MKRIMRRLAVAALAASMLVAMASVATAHHRTPSIQFNSAPLGEGLTVPLNASVTVTGEAFDVSTADRKSHETQRCVLDDAGAASAVCDEGAGTWTTVVSSVGSAHLATAWTAPTDVAGVFGWRVVTGGLEGDGSAHAADTADLTVTASSSTQRHNACNGIENAFEKSNGKGKAKLEEHVTKFNCDVSSTS